MLKNKMNIFPNFLKEELFKTSETPYSITKGQETNTWLRSQNRIDYSRLFWQWKGFEFIWGAKEDFKTVKESNNTMELCDMQCHSACCMWNYLEDRSGRKASQNWLTIVPVSMTCKCHLSSDCWKGNNEVDIKYF
jgi:hypothetical protein